MLSDTEISQLLAELNKVKSEVRELKGNINNLDRKKEEAFREKRKISSNIFSRIKVAKDSKDKRNTLTATTSMPVDTRDGNPGVLRICSTDAVDRNDLSILTLRLELFE